MVFPFLKKKKSPIWDRIHDDDSTRLRLKYDTYYPIFERQTGTRVYKDGKEYVMLSSNDYLGLSNHPKIKEAGIQALKTWGSSTTGARALRACSSISGRFAWPPARLIAGRSAWGEVNQTQFRRPLWMVGAAGVDRPAGGEPRASVSRVSGGAARVPRAWTSLYCRRSTLPSTAPRPCF